MTDESTCLLVSFEGESFEVLKSVALQSYVIKNILEDNDEVMVFFPLPDIKTHVLKLVVDFLYHNHNKILNIEKPIRSSNIYKTEKVLKKQIKNAVKRSKKYKKLTN
jgi:hypothetical protein